MLKSMSNSFDSFQYNFLFSFSQFVRCQLHVDSSVCFETDVVAQVVKYHNQEKMISRLAAIGHVSDEVNSIDDLAESSSLLQSLSNLLHCSIQRHNILDCSYYD